MREQCLEIQPTGFSSAFVPQQKIKFGNLILKVTMPGQQHHTK